ncbi:hypothetical protein SAMN02745126_03848 [Enhydrobacter aerosaccus]|uniref:Uncharacterized protein n=1 Tax=Enhydrobacter aerosaccus TaxID=225324 RepID=A0A1T4RJJ4_9HYPH|nr:hypothetical protein [Enhydrobacter aerosaccus]SKA15946.1 hypothetical protein SAMN02745126_03848 [Enhydrobacter aerosaccus]
MPSDPPFWHTAVAAEDKVSVAFPGKPEADTQKHVYPDENPPRTVFVHALFLKPAMGTSYFVIWQKPTFEPGDPQAGVEALKTFDSNFTVEFELHGREIEVEGVQGLEATWPTTTGYIERKRVFLVDGIAIEQCYEGCAGTENSPDVEKFFSSLKFHLKPERKTNG